MSFFRNLWRARAERPWLHSLLLALLLALIVFAVELLLGRGPLRAAIQATAVVIPWVLIWYFLDRKNRRDEAQLVEDGKFRGAIRTPQAIKDSLSERWASGAMMASAEGFGFQADEVASGIPAGPVSWFEVTGPLSRREVTVEERKQFSRPRYQIALVPTTKGLREIAITPESLLELERTIRGFDVSPNAE